MEARDLTFSSANSCMSETDLEELKAKQREANKLLLLLSEIEPVNQGLREAFDGLIGQVVNIHISSENEEENAIEVDQNGLSLKEITGRVIIAGRDFTLLRKNKDELLVAHERIRKVELKNRYAHPVEEPILKDINSLLKRKVTFNFGKVVSNSPELIHIFYGLTLMVYLRFLVHCNVEIILPSDWIQGEILCADENSLTICTNGQERNISYQELDYIKIIN